MIDTFAFLLLGHALADFVFQSDSIVARKAQPGSRAGALLQHGLILFACHSVAALPIASEEAAIAIAAVVAVHVFLDWAKSVADQRWHRPLLFFLLDQALHIVTLAGAALFLSSDASLWLALSDATTQWLAVLALYASAWILVWRGGEFFMAMLLAACKLDTSDAAGGSTDPNLGRLIGVLERLLVVTMVLEHAWAGIGLLVAAKSVARFKELDDRRFSEYYLVGTLGSLLIALAVGLSIRELLGH